EDVGIGGTGDELVVRRAGGVGPAAGRIDGEGAVGPSRAGLGHEGGRAVDVADRQHAGGGDVAGGVGLGQVLDVGRQHRGIVGAEDVDGHRGVGAVGAHHVEDVGIGGTGDELVVRRAGGVGPAAGRIDGEGAVGPSRAGLGHEGGRAVDVADRQHAGGGDVAGGVGLGQVLDVGRQHRGIVGAEDVDVHRGVGAVGAHHVEDVGIGGTGDELVVRRAGGVGPAAG